MTDPIEIRSGLEREYADVYTTEALGAVRSLAWLNADIKSVMSARMARRQARARDREWIGFLDPEALIAGTELRVQEARDGEFDGSEIPPDLERQWIQGTGPAAKPHTTLERSIRNVAYALLSGAELPLEQISEGREAVSSLSVLRPAAARICNFSSSARP